MASYPRGRNSVEGILFQISQDLPPQMVPFHQQITPEDLRKLIQTNPTATLQQLCEQIQSQRGILISTTAMCRLLKRHSVLHRRGYQAAFSDRLKPKAARVAAFGWVLWMEL